MVRVMELEGAKDPDEYIKRFGKDAFLLKKQNSMFVIDYKVKELKNQYDLTKSDQKFRFVREYFEKILIPISNEVERQEYIKKLSDLTGVNENVISKEFSKTTQKELKRIENINYFKQIQQKPVLSDFEMLKKNENYLLSLYTEWAPKSEEIKNLLTEEDFYTEDVKNIFTAVKNLINEGMELSYSMLLSFVTDESILFDLTSFSSKGFENADTAKKAIEELKVKIKTLGLKLELKAAQQQNDNLKITQILDELKKLKAGREGEGR